MYHTIGSLIGYRMEATDGEVGKVQEFYFDDETWTIRYLVLKTESWLSGRKVLISPVALLTGFYKPGLFMVNLTQDQIRKSPGIDTDKPVSRQQEIELYDHYAWQGYWKSGFYAGGSGAIVDSPPENGRKDFSTDLHLRSTAYVTGFHIHGTDGEIGCICDFIVDDQNWKMISLVVSTGHLPGEKKVLVSTAHVIQMQWNDAEVYLNETTADIEKSAVFDIPAK
jgi:sporulation protein YlmC with PRC-barrel domain